MSTTDPAPSGTTDTNQETTETADESGHRLSAGAIGGIVILGFFILPILTGFWLWVTRLRKPAVSPKLPAEGKAGATEGHNPASALASPLNERLGITELPADDLGPFELEAHTMP